MDIVWLLISVALIVGSVTGSRRASSEMTRIGLLFVAAAGAIFFLAVLLT